MALLKLSLLDLPDSAEGVLTTLGTLHTCWLSSKLLLHSDLLANSYSTLKTHLIVSFLQSHSCLSNGCPQLPRPPPQPSLLSFSTQHSFQPLMGGSLGQRPHGCPLCAPDFHLWLLRIQVLPGLDWRLPPFVKMPKDQASSIIRTKPSPGPRDKRCSGHCPLP